MRKTKFNKKLKFEMLAFLVDHTRPFVESFKENVHELILLHLTTERLKMRLFTLLVIALFTFQFLSSQDTISFRTYETTQIEIGAPQIDGDLSDIQWDAVPWAENFTVQQPNNGDSPKQKTKFKIIYDSEHLYIGFHCLHDEPTKIESRLARRDRFPGDWFEINIDSYNDNSTGYSFTLSVSDVKGDEFISNNGQNSDRNWNPIWYGKSKIVSDGWTGEMKIPFSQLRFGQQESYSWGFNITRRDFGSDERSSWQHVPRNVSGFVSNFANLIGIKNIKPTKQVELQPYVTTSVNRSPKEEGNPFADGSKTKFNLGLDGKIGITNDMTLDFSINPDFGQVEADPSALNLDGFQIFFDERRPFFIENANLFDNQISRLEAGGPFRNDNLFYSRRIGARPRGSVPLSHNAFVDRPDFTSILGAAKISGKTKKGLSIGFLESITAEEHLEVDLKGTRTTEIVEPLTNYLVGSLKQDFKQGQSTVGVTMTAVNRRLNNTGLEDQYHDQAYSGGINFLHTWKEREWRITGNFIFSNVSGSETKISDTQESFEHYYQRPDAKHISVDNTRTSLSGQGGTLAIGNYGGKDNLSYQGGITWRSPGLELNDIGFLNTADQIDYAQWVGYRFPKPFGIFRQLGVNYNHYMRWTYDWENLYKAINFNGFASFKNYWSVFSGITYEFKDISTKALFGGPKLRQSSGIAANLFIQSDNRKSLTYGGGGFGFRAVGKDAGAVKVTGINIFVSYQPTDALSLSLRPQYFHQNRAIQNVSFDSFEAEDRYITGRVNQKTFSMSLRANYSLSSTMTIEYWGQPFISKGNYSNFKFITDPLARVYTDRFHLYDQQQIIVEEGNEYFSIDENRDGFVDYGFDNPDFNFLQFRSNLVFRWEYRPNSELFLVWTQGTTNSGDPEKGIFPSLAEDLFGDDANNIFLLKLTYRFY